MGASYIVYLNVDMLLVCYTCAAAPPFPRAPNSGSLDFPCFSSTRMGLSSVAQLYLQTRIRGQFSGYHSSDVTGFQSAFQELQSTRGASSVCLIAWIKFRRPMTAQVREAIRITTTPYSLPRYVHRMIITGAVHCTTEYGVWTTLYEQRSPRSQIESLSVSSCRGFLKAA